jgi:hypothetical protein
VSDTVSPYKSSSWESAICSAAQKFTLLETKYSLPRAQECMGRNGAVGIATLYALDGLKIESRWGGDFPHPSSTALGTTQPPVKGVLHIFPEGKAAGGGVDHPPPSSEEVKERVELYFYSPSGPSWPVLGLNFPFIFFTRTHSEKIHAGHILPRYILR